MKKNVLVALVALGAVALSGCDETKTTEWYKEHPDEMNRVYATCKKQGMIHKIAVMPSKLTTEHNSIMLPF